MIVNYDSSIVNKFEVSLTDDIRAIVYDHHMFIVQATGANSIEKFGGYILYSFVS